MSKLNPSGELRFDASVVGLGLGVSRELNSSSGLRLDVSAVGLGLDALSELNYLDGLGLNISAVRLRLGVSSGHNLEGGGRGTNGFCRSSVLLGSHYVAEAWPEMV